MNKDIIGKNRKRIIYLMVCFVIAITISFESNAQEDLSFVMEFNEDIQGDNLNFDLVDITIVEYPAGKYNAEGGYELNLLDFNEDVIYSDTFILSHFKLHAGIVENITEEFLIPYDGNAHYLQVISSDGQLLLKEDINHLTVRCGDSFCSAFSESYETCPEDCASGSRDGYCDDVVDGICDLDCSLLNKEDLDRKDCNNEVTQQRTNIFNLNYLLVILLLIVAFIIYKNKDKFKQEPISNTEKQLRDYIKNAKKEGKDKEQTKQELIKSRWPRNLIDKYLK